VAEQSVAPNANFGGEGVKGHKARQRNKRTEQEVTGFQMEGSGLSGVGGVEGFLLDKGGACPGVEGAEGQAP